MRLAAILSILSPCTPLWSQWTVGTDVPAPFQDRPPAIASGPKEDVYVGSSDRVLRIAKDGQTVWAQRVPVEYVTGLAVNRDGEVFVIGSSGISHSVVKLDAQGAVIGSFPITGEPAAIMLDATGSAYITGTANEGFTTTPGAYKASFGQRRCFPRHSVDYLACPDAFVIKMRPNGAVEWATLLGGTWNEKGRAIAVDSNGNIWIVGETMSEDYPTSGNAAQRTFGGIVSLGPLGWGDAFVAQFDPKGERLVYSTYLGGTGLDYPVALTTVGSGIVVTGATQSADFPTSSNAAQSVFSDTAIAMPSSTLDAFVTHFSSSGQRVYSTYFGIKGAREAGVAAVRDGTDTVAIALSGRPGSCVLRYDAIASSLREECFRLGMYDPFGLTNVNGRWIAAGRTMQGHEVPGVTVAPRVVVKPLAGIGDNSGPIVVGTWNEYIPTRRPIVAPESFLSVYLSGIGRAGLENTTVMLGDRKLTLLYVGADQINAVVPSDMPVGVHWLTVSMPFFTTVPTPVDVIDRWPGLYSGAINEDGSINSETNPAPLGSIVSLFGNGFGLGPLPVIEPYISSKESLPGGAQGMQVLFAGRAPGAAAGLYQVNAKVPLNAQTGRVPLRLVLRVAGGFLQTPLGYIWVR